jgi:hypothetical protein
LHFDELAKLASTPGASDEIMDAAQNDGAARVFALYFGWAIAAFYFGAWALAFKVFGSIYKRFHKRPNANRLLKLRESQSGQKLRCGRG